MGAARLPTHEELEAGIQADRRRQAELRSRIEEDRREARLGRIRAQLAREDASRAAQRARDLDD